MDGRNLITGINTWTISLLRYPASFLEWTKDELRLLERRTRILLNIYGVLHSTDSVAWLYLPRKMVGHGLIAVVDFVIQAELGLAKYVAESNERLIIVARYGTRSVEKNPSGYKERKKEECKKFMGRNCMISSSNRLRM